MSQHSFSGIILQPHNTLLSQLLHQHRTLLGKLSETIPLYPVHPCHCFVASTGSLGELKKQVTACTILPPQIEQGYLFRPVELTGAKLHGFPPEILHQALPFIPEKELQAIPTGFIFGYLHQENGKKNAQQKLATVSKDIQPVKLRVFRLHHIQYSWNPDSPSLNWTMELPHWVKIHTPH